MFLLARMHLDVGVADPVACVSLCSACWQRGFFVWTERQYPASFNRGCGDSSYLILLLYRRRPPYNSQYMLWTWHFVVYRWSAVPRARAFCAVVARTSVDSPCKPQRQRGDDLFCRSNRLHRKPSCM